ncbi:hypothetical protein DUI87_08374 [Hirundo rustica rustica]|uniref:Gfo/Idh/MocA-like oxidoreductase N-terminal domain-containing protein n=1 Tax=Hirundo rustica rustica TaxID=333673 RepID=A0A3M0KZK9_HIRRU|nr:hypothetical protein DUI87_08374 [Hirundo rustica rustica]
MLPGVGVFGTGLTARVIVPLLKAEGFAVKALWGRTPEEAEELAKEMSVPFYTSRIDEVLLHQDVDLVCVNLPPPLTRQVAVKTLVLGLGDSEILSPDQCGQLQWVGLNLLMMAAGVALAHSAGGGQMWKAASLKFAVLLHKQKMCRIAWFYEKMREGIDKRADIFAKLAKVCVDMACDYWRSLRELWT